MSLPAQKPPTLYSLTYEYRDALNQLEMIDPDDPNAAEEVALTLGMLKDEIAIKAPAVACYALELEKFAEMVSEAASRMAQRASKIKKRAESLKAYLLTNLLALPEGNRKHENDELCISVRKNPSPVEIAPGTILPDQYMRDPSKVEVPPLQLRALTRLARAVAAAQQVPIDAQLEAHELAHSEITSALAGIRANGGLPEIERQPDKKAIAEALKAGKEVPGCKLVPSYRLHIE